MTPLEHAKAVVERSRVAKLSARATAAIGEVRTIVSGAEAEAIGRLVAWAECQIAVERAREMTLDTKIAREVLDRYGCASTGIDGFVRELRDALITKGYHDAG